MLYCFKQQGDELWADLLIADTDNFSDGYYNVIGISDVDELLVRPFWFASIDDIQKMWDDYKPYQISKVLQHKNVWAVPPTLIVKLKEQAKLDKQK